MSWAEGVVMFLAGFGTGALFLWVHFGVNRLIRTDREWYSDPLVAERYPDAAERALAEEDEHWY